MQGLSPNSTLSHYRIVSKLGAGGMGEVWLAEDTRLDRKVALKILPADFTQDAQRVRRFTLEAKAASALNHPNIITVYDIGECKAGRFIVMELVAGHTLRAIIASDNSSETLLGLSSQMARALSAAHAAGITHRDIKPENIMVRDDGYVKMLDFGLARLLPTTESDPEAPTLAQQTTPGTVMGSIAYMSPEQVSGQTVGPPSDVFSLGTVLFELATGQHPMKAETMLGYMHAITLRTPPSLISLKPELPAAFEALVLRMLEKEASKRPTASEVAKALHEIERNSTNKSLLIRSGHDHFSGATTTSAAREVLDEQEKAGFKTDSATANSAGVRAEEGFWVAVLPFKTRAANPDLEALAEGLSEDIVTGLSRFSYLRVIARISTLRFTSETSDIRSVGKELGARYVMEGSLRLVGAKLRVTVQLVDTSSGAHLWAETYDRAFNAEEIFALQDDLVPRIVSTVADWYGVLTHSMSETLRSKDPNQLTPYEAVLRSFGYYERVTSEEHASARAALERVVEQAPGNSDAWAMLSFMYGEEHRFGFNAKPDPLDRALTAARRAADVAPCNHFANLALAQALFFRKEFDAFRSAAERAITLNPMDGSAMQYMAHLIAFAGDWEYGCDVAERARQLNPNHPGWYWAVPFYHAYQNGDYDTARTIVLKVDMPHMFFWYVMRAAVYAQLGEREAAEVALRELVRLKPDFARTGRNELAKWYLPELVESLMDGLGKAGLEVSDKEAEAHGLPAKSSAIVRAFERPAIAVLPLENLSADPEQEFFADGLAEDLITRLSLWRSFPVIARNSSFVYKHKAVDIKKVAAELGVRYVVEGSVRKSGNRVRISAQLIDGTTEQHVWAKTYDRELTDVFAIQDEISAAIAASLVGDLQRAEQMRAVQRPPGNFEAWELYQRALPLIHKFTRDTNEEAGRLLQQAIALDPHFSTPLARLAEVGVWQVMYEWTEDPDGTLAAAIAQARQAVALDHLGAQARCNLAFALMSAGDGQGAREEARRAVELNPCLPFALALHAYLEYMAGSEPEDSIRLMQHVQQLSPNDPVEWLFHDVLAGAYLNAGRFADGIEAGRRLISLSPNYYWGYLWSALNMVGLGKIDEARALVREARRVKPELSFALARKCLGQMAPDVERRFCDALRQAGLEKP